MSIPDAEGSIWDTVNVELQITNADLFTAFQTDIKIPPGISYLLSSAVLTERSNGHIMRAELLPENILRVLAFSLSQDPFFGDSGAVMTFNLVLGDSIGNFPIELVNPIISDAASQNILTGFTNGIITVKDTLVPVELHTFFGTRQPEGVQLFWTTVSETNNMGFSIERQCASSNWETIGFVGGKGTSLNLEQYTFFDQLPFLLRQITVSYRIKQVDFDGGCVYYDSIAFEPENSNKEFVLFQNFPNPFNPSTRIGFYSPESQSAHFIITNLNGQKIFEEKLNVQPGYNQIEWLGKDDRNTTAPSGIYFYSIVTETQTASKKMIFLR